MPSLRSERQMLIPDPATRIVLQMRPAVDMDDDQFFTFCQQNSELRLERTADGDLIIMPPVGGETGNRNFEITGSFGLWVEKDGRGIGFDSSAGFNLPNGATRSPDVSWILKERLATLTPEQKQKFPPLCPDFVIELWSPSDTLEILQDKMEEYRDNGGQLGWLIYPPDRQVYVYRPGVPVERLDDPATVAGDPELPGFVLDVQAIFDPRW
jgi:Uma2 family endonuclease